MSTIAQARARIKTEIVLRWVELNKCDGEDQNYRLTYFSLWQPWEVVTSEKGFKL